MDSNQRERQAARQALTLQTRPLARPGRFEPQQLVDSRSTAQDDHARQFVEMRERARVEGLALARVEVEAVMAEHAAATRQIGLLAAALSAAIDQLTGRDRDDLSHIEEQAVCFGIELAEQLVGRELASVDDKLAAAMTRAIDLVPRRGAIVLRINPLDRNVADEVMEVSPELADRLELVADATIERGGCVAVIGPLHVDAQLGPALQRVRDVVES